MNEVTLELNPLEAGLLLGVLIKEMSNNPVNNDLLEPIYKRLVGVVDKKFYEEISDD